MSWLLVQCFLGGNQSTPILKHEPKAFTDNTNTYLPVSECLLYLGLIVDPRHVFQILAWPSAVIEVAYPETELKMVG